MHESTEKWVNCKMESLKGSNLSIDTGIGIKLHNKEI
jgi:hypothetical protein